MLSLMRLNKLPLGRTAIRRRFLFHNSSSFVLCCRHKCCIWQFSWMGIHFSPKFCPKLLSNYSEVINWSCFLHPPMSHGSSNWRVLPTNLYWFDYISSSAYPNSDLEVGPNNLVNIKRVFEYWGQQLSSVHLVNDHTQTSLMLQYLPKTNTNDEIGIDRYDEID